MTPEDVERERPYLFGIAYRILGTAADAEDVLQEAFLRAREIDDARSPRAVLATIVTRLCLDEVRSARRRREAYVGDWLPEPLLTDAPSAGAPPSAADRVADAESVSMAFLVLLESLSPLERAVYVLREVLDLDVAEVAEAVGRSEAAVRQLAHRAKEHVAARRRRFPAPPQAQHSLTMAFLGALASGDVDALAKLFTDDVRIVPDHGGKATSFLNTLEGADRASRYFAGMAGRMKDGRYGVEAAAMPAWIGGAPAFLVTEGGVVTSATVLEVVAGPDGAPRIAQVFVVRNPDKLAAIRHGIHYRA
jgi:RNA polymerase sigma-70 factor (ECF subfamily)